MFPSVAVYGFDTRIPALSKSLAHNDNFFLGRLRIQAIHTPCHTTGSLSFVVHDDEQKPSAQAIFTGDTLFLAGCGRFFEGSPEEMQKSLIEKIGSLPASVKTFVGHEYTIKNLQVSGIVTSHPT